MLKEEVDEQDIARVVSRWTGIPVSRLMEGEREKHGPYGRTPAPAGGGAVGSGKSGQRWPSCAPAGPQGPQPAGGQLYFPGAYRSGQDRAFRALAQTLFDDERNIIRIDMSEYMETHTVARLIGAPPGYVGYEEGGQLTEAVRRKPYSVVLFDEIEKAHYDVFNVFLQSWTTGA
jgi:ATP-dependent Clp protease ATP-binding subunit ClpB